MELYAVIFLLTGAILGLLAWIWSVRIGFHVHPAWGGALLIVPPVLFVFLVFQWKRMRFPFALLLIAAITGCIPFLLVEYDRYVHSFGPREKMVDGELHITLTGWKQQDYERLANRPDVVVLQMANPDVTDETLQWLRDKQLLRELDLNDTNITDAGLAILAELPALQSLRLRNTQVSDEGFRQHLFDKSSLQEVDLTGTTVLSKTLRQWKNAGDNRKYLR